MNGFINRAIGRDHGAGSGRFRGRRRVPCRQGAEPRTPRASGALAVLIRAACRNLKKGAGTNEKGKRGGEPPGPLRPSGPRSFTRRRNSFGNALSTYFYASPQTPFRTLTIKSWTFVTMVLTDRLPRSRSLLTANSRYPLSKNRGGRTEPFTTR